MKRQTSDRPTNEVTLADKLKLLRWERGLTIREVSAATRINVASIGVYERGEHGPTFWNFLELARFYNVSLDYLAGFSERRALNEIAKYQNNDRTRTREDLLGSGFGQR